LQSRVPQCSEYVEDGYVEAIYDLLSAEPSGRDSAQDQSRGGSCEFGLPLLDPEELVDIRMHFIANLFARPQAHHDQLGVLSRE
jgi:hypothetical protein